MSRPPLRWIGPALLLVLAVTGLGAILLFSAEEGDYRIYEPIGYVLTVDRMIAQGKLAYDCSRRTIALVGLNDDDEYFARYSYLGDDIEAFNGGDPRPFRVEAEELAGGRCRGEVVAIDPTYRNQRLPGYVAESWRGRLFLHQESGTTALSGARLLEVTRAPLGVLPLDAKAFEDVWFGPQAADARSHKMAWKMLEEGRKFAALECLGDPAVLEVVEDRPQVLLNGCRAGHGWRLRLDHGDVVRVRLDGRLDDRYTVEAGEQAGLLSVLSTVNGEPRRKTFTRRLPMARDVVYAFDTLVAARPEGVVARDDFDVHLTLDAFFHNELSGLLGDFSRARYGDRPLRAAITMLEPASGRVLALASYPGPTDLDRLRLDDRRRARLAANHNFDRHAVGSAGKPFLAAAALATRPELANLRLHCYAGPADAPPEDLLGLRLGEYNLPGDCGGREARFGHEVGFVDFLRVSSNRYMLYLGLLAMADWRGGAPVADGSQQELPQLDRYLLAAGEQRLRPRLPIVDRVTAEATLLGDVADQEFVRNARRLFGVRFEQRVEPTERALELEYWAPVLRRELGIHRGSPVRALAPVTPERVNFGANRIQNLRQGLYTLLLGGGESRWSNPQLAEAMARLVTGRPVRASLVERVELPALEDDGEPEVLWSLERDGAADAEWLLADDHRRLILDGMRAVVEEAGGTGRSLLPALAPINQAAPAGVGYRLYAKTGTPTSPPELLRRQGTEPARDAIKPFSGRPQTESGVLVLAVERAAAGETSHLVLTFYIEGQGGSEEALALAGAVLRPVIESYWPQDWLVVQPGPG